MESSRCHGADTPDSPWGSEYLERDKRTRTRVRVNSHWLRQRVFFFVCQPLWCWDAKGWKCRAYCRASICLQIPPLSRLMKYKRCSLNSRLLLRSKRRCRFVTAHLMKMKQTQTRGISKMCSGKQSLLYKIKHRRTLVQARDLAFVGLRGFCSALETAASYSYR